MSKDFFVLRGGRVVYTPGHYDLAGAVATAKSELSRHPKSLVRIVEVVYSPWAEFELSRPSDTGKST